MLQKLIWTKAQNSQVKSASIFSTEERITSRSSNKTLLPRRMYLHTIADSTIWVCLIDQPNISTDCDHTPAWKTLVSCTLASHYIIFLSRFKNPRTLSLSILSLTYIKKKNRRKKNEGWSAFSIYSGRTCSSEVCKRSCVMGNLAALFKVIYPFSSGHVWDRKLIKRLKLDICQSLSISHQIYLIAYSYGAYFAMQ